MSKIIKSNRQPNTTTSRSATHLHVFWTHPGTVTPPPPWATCSSAWPLFQYTNFSWYPIWTSLDATWGQLSWM